MRIITHLFRLNINISNSLIYLIVTFIVIFSYQKLGFAVVKIPPLSSLCNEEASILCSLCNEEASIILSSNDPKIIKKYIQCYKENTKILSDRLINIYDSENKSIGLLIKYLNDIKIIVGKTYTNIEFPKKSEITELKSIILEIEKALSKSCVKNIEATSSIEKFKNAIAQFQLKKSAIIKEFKFENTSSDLIEKICKKQKKAFKLKLQNIAKQLRNDITLYDKSVLGKFTTIGILTFDRNDAKEKIKIIESVISIAEIKKKLYITHEDYPMFSVNLYAGIESKSVDSITSPNDSRIGILAYQQANGERHKGFHFYANFLLTTSPAIDSNTGKPIENAEAEQALETNFNIFWALLDLNLGDLYALFGPVRSFGIIKTDNNVHITKRNYYGIRSAISPESFTEILYGRTSGFRSRRLEIRLQVPIARFDNGSRIFLGSVYNIAIKGENRINEADVVSVYLSWHVKISDIWNIDK